MTTHGIYTMMIPYFLFSSLLVEALLVSGFPHQHSLEEGKIISKRSAGFGRPGGYGEPADVGPDVSPPQAPSFGSQGQPTDPNASSNSGSSGLGFPGVPARPDGRPQSGGYPGGPSGAYLGLTGPPDVISSKSSYLS